MSKMDKTNFVNITFEDNSIYYGEVAWFNEEGEQVAPPSQDQTNNTQQEEALENTDNAEIEDKLPKSKMLRHGNGAQIFLRQDNTVLCKYEGEWVQDAKCKQIF